MGIDQRAAGAGGRAHHLGKKTRARGLDRAQGAPCCRSACAGCCADHRFRRSDRARAHPRRPRKAPENNSSACDSSSLPARRSRTRSLKASKTRVCRLLRRATSSGFSGWNGIKDRLGFAGRIKAAARCRGGRSVRENRNPRRQRRSSRRWRRDRRRSRPPRRR